MGRLTKRHGKHAVQIGGETRRNDIGWLALADYEDLEGDGRLIEQKHGTWLEADDGDGVVCSVCRTDFCTLIFETDSFIYCPNCGAKLKELKGDKE